MCPIRSTDRKNELGVTLVEVLLVTMLGMIVMLGAGAVYRGVDKSYKDGARQLTGTQNASLLTTVLSRRVRVASDFLVYDAGNRTAPADTGNSIALMDETGAVTYRFEWDNTNRVLTDSSGVSVAPVTLSGLRFMANPATPRTLRFEYRADCGEGGSLGVETAVSLRN